MPPKEPTGTPSSADDFLFSSTNPWWTGECAEALRNKLEKQAAIKKPSADKSYNERFREYDLANNRLKKAVRRAKKQYEQKQRNN